MHGFGKKYCAVSGNMQLYRMAARISVPLGNVPTALLEDIVEMDREELTNSGCHGTSLINTDVVINTRDFLLGQYFALAQLLPNTMMANAFDKVLKNDRI